MQRVTDHSVDLADGDVLNADLVVGAAGARPYPWVANLGLETHEGFITIDNTLRSLSDPNIFAVGDCAHMGFAPRPKAGVFAVRQAPVLFNNISAVLTGRKLERYDPPGRLPEADLAWLEDRSGRQVQTVCNGKGFVAAEGHHRPPVYGQVR